MAFETDDATVYQVRSVVIVTRRSGRLYLPTMRG